MKATEYSKQENVYMYTHTHISVKTLHCEEGVKREEEKADREGHLGRCYGDLVRDGRCLD